MTNLVTTPSGAKFTLFFSIRSPFSNFHPCRMTITDEDGDGTSNSQFFNSTEQYYMYHKALSSGDIETANEIMKEREARKIKMLGKNVKNFDRNKWDSMCEDVMWRGNIAKYTQNDDLRKKLFYTHGSILVECSPSDAIWGIGMDIHEPDALDPAKWRGQNKLGHILTRIREHLWEQPEYAQEVKETIEVLKNFDKFAQKYFQPPKPRSILRAQFNSANSIVTTEGEQLLTKQPNWVGTPVLSTLPLSKRSRSRDADDGFSPAAKKPCLDDQQPTSANGSTNFQSERGATMEDDYRRLRQGSGRDERLMISEDRYASRREKSVKARRRHTRDECSRSRHDRHRRHHHKRSRSSSSSRSASAPRGRRHRRGSSSDEESRRHHRSHRRRSSRRRSDSDSDASSETNRRRRHRKMHSPSSDSSADRSPKTTRSKRVRIPTTESEVSTSESVKSGAKSGKWYHGTNVFTSLLQKLRQKPSGLWEKMESGNKRYFEPSITNSDQFLHIQTSTECKDDEERIALQ